MNRHQVHGKKVERNKRNKWNSRTGERRGNEGGKGEVCRFCWGEDRKITLALSTCFLWPATTWNCLQKCGVVYLHAWVCACTGMWWRMYTQMHTHWLLCYQFFMAILISLALQIRQEEREMEVNIVKNLALGHKTVSCIGFFKGIRASSHIPFNHPLVL